MRIIKTVSLFFLLLSHIAQAKPEVLALMLATEAEKTFFLPVFSKISEKKNYPGTVLASYQRTEPSDWSSYRISLTNVPVSELQLRQSVYGMEHTTMHHSSILKQVADYPVITIDFLKNDQSKAWILQDSHADILEKEKNRPQHFFLDAVLAAFALILNADKDLFFVIWTSLQISFFAVLIAALISVPLGILVALNRFTGKSFLLTCLNTLMALPTVLVGLLLYGLLNRQGLLGDLGLLYTPVAMIIGQCILIIPVIWNLCISAVNGADPRLSRTCTALGANHLQCCFIYMSEVRFALTAAIVTGFGRAIGEVGIAMMLGGNINGYTRTMTTAIALETSKGDFEFALALGFVLLGVAFIVNVLLHRFQQVAR